MDEEEEDFENDQDGEEEIGEDEEVRAMLSPYPTLTLTCAHRAEVGPPLTLNRPQ